MTQKKKNGIQNTLAKMTILPVVILCFIATALSIFCVSRSMAQNIEDELKHLAGTLTTSLDTFYPGDFSYTVENDALAVKKGDTPITSKTVPLEYLKDTTSAEYTIFIGDIRILSTIHDQDGKSIIGTKANVKIVNDVYNKTDGAFYHSVDIYGTRYYCYYISIFNEDGTCVGMIACCKSAATAQKMIFHAALPIFLIGICIIILSYFWAYHSTQKFADVIRRLNASLMKTADGKFSNTVSPDLLARKDEFGEMSHSIIKMQSSLRLLVETDMLTSLYNRRFGQQRLESILKEYQGTNRTFSLALGDIDFFKQFNDTYGHDCGDEVLIHISSILKDTVKDYGYAIRWGGEEFLLVLTNGTYEEHEKILKKMINDIEASTIHYANMDLQVTMTFGLISVDTSHTEDELLSQVDTLLYKGKKDGRNRLESRSLPRS